MDEDTKASLRSTVPREVTDGEFQLFLDTAEKTGLNPFSRHLYLIRRGSGHRPEVSIDGFRSIAAGTGEYEGQTPYQWCGPSGEWVDVWLGELPPVAARVGVYRRGFREPIYSIARYSGYVQLSGGRPNSMWAKMPDNQLAKCAEALALRRAFPNVLGGLYTSDEMGQAGNDEPANLGPNDPLGFGKHRATPLCDVPDDYLDWLLSKADRLPAATRSRVEAELASRSGEQHVD